MFLRSQELLAMCYLRGHERGGINLCYTRVSDNQGRTWGDICKHPDLPVCAPRMNKIGGDLLAVTGRSLADNAVAAFLSTDNGEISSSSSDPRAWAIVPTPSLFQSETTSSAYIAVPRLMLWRCRMLWGFCLREIISRFHRFKI